MNQDNLINRAKDFAHRAHDSINQVRKYTGEPYWVHTDEVAETVAEHGGTDFMIAAAHLHDYREDVVTSLSKQTRFFDLFVLEAEYNSFPIEVRAHVAELTDMFTSENYPYLNRATRKVSETTRIANISTGSKVIKLADLKSNTTSIIAHDPDFAVTYLAEKARLLEVLGDSNEVLFDKVVKQLEGAKIQLQENAVQESLRELEQRELDRNDLF